MSEREIFQNAIERADPADREAFIAKACGSDAELRARITRLLRLHESGPALSDLRFTETQTLDSRHAAEDGLPVPPLDSILAALLAPSPRADAIGRLGHYDILQALGQGAFGIVLKAFDDTLHRVVAIKVLHPHLARTSPPRKRFLREARAAAAVKHENVVQIYSVEEEPIPYLVMEFVEGQSVQNLMNATGPLEAAEVIRLGRQIALGLAAAHEQGLVHRDVKPANLLLEKGVESRIKLTDFGLARTNDAASLTQSGVIAGTPLYMAPEQVKGEPLDARTDLFSLGSVLYAMVTGHPPFRAPTTLAVMKRVADDKPRPIGEIFPETPEFLTAIIARLLEKNPELRFGSAREVAEAFASGSVAHPPAEPTKPRRSLRRPILAFAGLLAIAALAVWGFGQFKHGENTAVDVPAPLPAGTLIVTSSADDGREGTLRWAVEQANAHFGEDTIAFDAAAFSEPTTITLTRGPLVFLDEGQTTILGPPAGLTLSAAKKSKVMIVGSPENPLDSMPAKLQIKNLTIAEGSSSPEQPHGGAILCASQCHLTLVNCTLRDNEAPYRHPQTGQGGGGAIFSWRGNVTLINCTLAQNTSDEGGAIKSDGGKLTKLIHCTVVGNRGHGGGIFTSAGGEIVIYNSLFANNDGGSIVNVNSVFTGDGNITDDDFDAGGESLKNTNPRLGTLGRYGGPTETFPLMTGSPAVNFGIDARIPEDITTDQRGLPRIARGRADCGAFEVQ